MRTQTAVTAFVSLLVCAAVVPAGAGGVGGNESIEASSGTHHHGGYEYDANLSTGGVHWTGQWLYFQGSATGETYTLHEVDGSGTDAAVGRTVQELSVDANGSVVLETDQVGAGEYVLTGPAGKVVQTDDSGVQSGTADPDDSEAVARAAVEVVDQRFSVDTGRDSSVVGRSLDFSLTSNREPYTVEITSYGLSSAELRKLFGGEETDDGTRVRVTDGRLDANLWGIDTGIYRFSFDVVDTDADASTTITVEQPNEMALREQTVRTAAGSLATIDLSCQPGCSGALRVGSDERGYNTTVRFEDDDFDGIVSLTLNTYLAGNHTGAGEREAWSVENGDLLTNVTRHSHTLDDPLDPTGYNLQVRRDGTERDIGLLALGKSSLDTLTTGTLQGDEFGQSPGETPSMRTNRIAVADVLVVNVTAPGLLGLLAAQSGDDPTARFQSLVDSPNAGFTLTREVLNVGDPGPDLDLARSIEAEAVEVFTDDARQTLSITMDAAALQFHDGREGLRPEDELELAFELTEESGLVSSDRTVESTVRATERSLSFETGDDGNVSLPAASDATVRGQTTVSPGTELYFRLRLNGTLRRGLSTAVRANRTFAVEVNLSGIAPGTTVQITPAHFETTVRGTVTGLSTEPPVTEPPVTTTEPPTRTEPAPTVTTTDSSSTTTKTPTPTTATTPTPVPLTTAANASNDRPTSTATVTAGGGAGFGPGVAVLAVVGLALMRRRRPSG